MYEHVFYFFLSVFNGSIGDVVEANKYILVKENKYKLGRLLSMSEVAWARH